MCLLALHCVNSALIAFTFALCMQLLNMCICARCALKSAIVQVYCVVRLLHICCICKHTAIVTHVLAHT